MAATIIAPSTFAQNQGDLGYSYVFAALDILEQITEKLDVLDAGLLTALGEFTQTGSDTIRITRFTGLGHAERMTAMASETDPIVATGFSTAFDTLTVARYGLAKEESMGAMLFGRNQSVTLQDMQAMAPDSFLATVRYLLAVAGSGISSTIGTSGSAWSYDDELEIRSSYSETEGFDQLAQQVYSVRHPEQFTDLAHALRNEPAFQGSELLRQLLGLQRGENGAIDVIGLRSFQSHDVQASGGDHLGFTYVGGAAVIGSPSTAVLAPRLSSDKVHIVIDELGTVMTRSGDGSTTVERFDMNSWVGVGFLDPTLFPQYRIRSVND